MGIFQSYDILKVATLQSWIVPILHVIIWIFLLSCLLLLLLSPGNQRKLETYGYIPELWYFECFSLKVELYLFYMLSSGFFCTAAFFSYYWVQGTKENCKLMGIFRSYDILKVAPLKSWIVPILHVIIWIFLHSCLLLLLLSPGNQRKLETYGYIPELWHFESCPP